MGWLSRIKRAVSVFWALPVSAKALVFETWVESVRVMIVLRSPWWRRLLDASVSNESQSMVNESRIEEIALLANRTMSSPLLRMSCLERSLSLQTILRRRGVFASLVIGARPEENERIAAHAWLDHPALPKDSQSNDFHRLHNPQNFV